MLTAAWKDAWIVNTRALSPLHYAMTVRFWASRTRSSRLKDVTRAMRSDVNASIRAYQRHTAALRAAHAQNPRYVEVCFACGDDLFTLARALRLNLTLVQQVHAHAKREEARSNGSRLRTARHTHPVREDEQRAAFLREHERSGAQAFST